MPFLLDFDISSLFCSSWADFSELPKKPSTSLSILPVDAYEYDGLEFDDKFSDKGVLESEPK